MSNFEEEVRNEVANAENEVGQALEHAGRHIEETEAQLRERKKEAKDTVNKAATVVADKLDGVANEAAIKGDKAEKKVAEASHQASNALAGIQARILSSIDTLKKQFAHYSKDPSQIGHAIKNQLDAKVHDRLLVIFLVMWAPIWIMVAGSGVGQIVNLFLHNIQYFLGLAAAVYVWQLLVASSPTPNYQQKTLIVYLVASIVPIVVLDIESVILKVVAMLAFSGAPFLFTLMYSGSVTEKDLNKLTTEERLIQFATASSAVFGLSILPGDNSLIHRIFIAGIFGGAAYGAHFLIPIVLSKVPEQQKPVVDPHQVVVFALLEIILANLLLFILSFVMPQSVLDAEHSAWAVLGLTLLGLVFLAGGNVLSNGFLTGKVPAQTGDMIKKYGAMGIVGAYVILMLAYVMHLKLFSFGGANVTTVTVNE